VFAPLAQEQGLSKEARLDDVDSSEQKSQVKSSVKKEKPDSSGFSNTPESTLVFIAEDVVIPPSPAGEGAEEAPAADENKTEATPKQKHDKLRTLTGNFFWRLVNEMKQFGVH
jgi:hypothetical protein